jgi:hypothetical protein
MADAPEKTSRPRRFSFTRRPQKQVLPAETRSSFTAVSLPGDTDLPFEPPSHVQVRREICVSPTWKKKDKQQPGYQDVKSLDLAVSGRLPAVDGEPRRLTKKQPLPPSRRASIASSDISENSHVAFFSSLTARIRSRRASLSHGPVESSLQSTPNSQHENGEIPDAILSMPRLSNAVPERFSTTISRGLLSNSGPDLFTRSSTTQDSDNSQNFSYFKETSSRPGSSEKKPTLRRAGAGISLYQAPAGASRRAQPSIANGQATENTQKGRSKENSDSDKSTSSTFHSGLQVTTTKTEPKMPPCRQELEYDSSNMTPPVDTTSSPLKPPPRNPHHVGVSRKLRDVTKTVSTEHNSLSNHPINVMSSESKASEPAAPPPRKQKEHGPPISSTKTRQSAPLHPNFQTSANELDEPPVFNHEPLKSSESVPTTRRPFTSSVPCYNSIDRDSQHSKRTSSQPEPCLVNGDHSPGADAASVQTNTGLQKQKYLAKIFVICCSCKSWHDMPSDLYARMVIPETFSLPEQLELSTPGASDQSRGGSSGRRSRSRSQSQSQSTRQSVSSMMTAQQTPPIPNSTVKCCWCNHGMTRSCCSGWTTLVHLLEKHH